MEPLWMSSMAWYIAAHTHTLTKQLAKQLSRITPPQPQTLQTPLHFAALRNNIKMIDLLLQRGGDPDIKDAVSLLCGGRGDSLLATVNPRPLHT